MHCLEAGKFNYTVILASEIAIVGWMNATITLSHNEQVIPLHLQNDIKAHILAWSVHSKLVTVISRIQDWAKLEQISHTSDQVNSR